MLTNDDHIGYESTGTLLISSWLVFSRAAFVSDLYLLVAYKGTLTLLSPSSHNRLIRKGSNTSNALSTVGIYRPTNTTLTIQSIALPSDLYSFSLSFATGPFMHTTVADMAGTSNLPLSEAAHSTVPNLMGPTQTAQTLTFEGPTVHTRVPTLNGPTRTTSNIIMAHSSVPDLNGPTQRTQTSVDLGPTRIRP